MRLIPIALLASAAILPAQEPVPTFGTTVVIPGGLRGEVYHIKKDTERLPDFAKLKPKGAIYTSELNVPAQDWRTGFPGVTDRFEWFAIDYRGRFWIAKPDMYRFRLTSDDGARLYIDDQLIADNDGVHQVERRFASLRLSGGIHTIRVSYFQGPRFHLALILEIAEGGEGRAHWRVFGTSEFKPPANPETWQFPAEVHDR